jgi:hypothetical protein
LLEQGQLDALRDIQTATGATVAEQIRRAIADWIAARHVPACSNPDSAEALYAELKKLADEMPALRHLEKSLRKTLIRQRELDAIERGERTEKEADRFVGKASRRRKS